jgi:DNA adenine methylase
MTTDSNTDSTSAAASALDTTANPSCRPFLKWAGGKTQLLPQLVRRIPQQMNRYLEPFLGGGALYFALQPRVAYLADCNTELVNCFSVVQSNVDELIKELATYRYDEEMYYAVREMDRKEDFAQLSPVARAARFIYLNKTCFNGLYRVNSKGHFNVPFGKYTNPTIVDEKNLRACSAVLKSAVLAKTNFDDITEVAEKGDFVYFDPPYAPVSETADFTDYAAGGFDESAQELLLLVCLKLHRKGVNWMVSNSNAAIIQELYRGFKIEPVGAARAINSKGSKRGPVVELIIRNY